MLGTQDAKVAVCTLGDPDLPNEFQQEGLLDRVAIIGSLCTENLGIERMVRNVVANPRIRFLILCGKDSQGHRAGQAILSLKANGTDESKQIIGAMGPRPVLKNLSHDEITAFRQNVCVIDEIGTTDLARLKNIVEKTNQVTDSPIVLPPKVHLPKSIKAQKLKEWLPDPEGFFLVLVNLDERIIICEHYTNDHVLNEVIKGSNAADITNTVIRRRLISRLDHVGYLGRELAKAEAALQLGLKYVQDQSLTTNLGFDNL